MRAQAVLALQGCRGDEAPHCDHILDFPFTASLAPASQSLIPFLQLSERRQKASTITDDADLLPHQTPQRVAKFLPIEMIALILRQLIAGRRVMTGCDIQLQTSIRPPGRVKAMRLNFISTLWYRSPMVKNGTTDEHR